MTHDPERWLRSAGSAESAERDLLLSIRDASPPTSAKEAAWLAIASQIAATGAVVGLSAVTQSAGSAASANALTSATQSSIGAAVHGVSMLKLAAAVGIALAGVGGASAWLRHRQVPAAPTVAVIHSPAQSSAVGQGPAALPLPEPQIEQPKVPVAVNPPQLTRSTPKLVVDAIAKESSRLAEARAALRSGNPDRAKHILTRLAVEMPKAALSQEREVLMIEVLAAQGKAPLVQRRVRAFILAHPDSPHSAQLARFLEHK